LSLKKKANFRYLIHEKLNRRLKKTTKQPNKQTNTHKTNILNKNSQFSNN